MNSLTTARHGSWSPLVHPLSGRYGQWGWTLSVPTVALDEGPAMQLPYGESVTFWVEPGEHVVRVNPSGIEPVEEWVWAEDEPVVLEFVKTSRKSIAGDRIRYVNVPWTGESSGR